MSSPKKPQPVVLFLGILLKSALLKDKNFINKIWQILEKNYNNTIDVLSLKIPFLWSLYYQNEMGQDITRIFVIFKQKVDRSFLLKAKKISDKIEQDFAINNKRVINIDPGLITKENVVLSTNKNFFHRIYIGDGVFAEITLYYKNGSFRPIYLWTYPEYGSEGVIDFFNDIREIFYLKKGR